MQRAGSGNKVPIHQEQGSLILMLVYHPQLLSDFHYLDLILIIMIPCMFCITCTINQPTEWATELLAVHPTYHSCRSWGWRQKITPEWQNDIISTLPEEWSYWSSGPSTTPGIHQLNLTDNKHKNKYFTYFFLTLAFQGVALLDNLQPGMQDLTYKCNGKVPQLFGVKKF